MSGGRMRGLGGPMSDIFISYASQDRAIAQRLATALAAEGWSVWWDRTIMPGKSFARMIEDALDDTRCVVVLWSRVSRDSDWVQNEARHGHEQRALIPALIEDVKPPFEFQHIHAASLIDWEGGRSHPGYHQLVAAISGLSGAPPKREHEARRKTQEEQAKREAEEEAARREAEKEAEQKKAEAKRKAEEQAGARRKAEEKEAERKTGEAETTSPEAPPAGPQKPKRSKAPWIAAGAVVVLLAIGLAVVQPWRPQTQPTTPSERTESKSKIKSDVAAGASKTLEPGETLRDCDVCPEMVVVPAGSFVMGSLPDEPERDADEGPVPYTVRIPKPFAVGVYEVTNAEFVAFLNAVGRRGPAKEPWFETKSEDGSSRIVSSGGNRYGVEKEYENYPVVNVSWHGARAYADWLKEKTGDAYRLLTEAEWEYVARAETKTRYWWGDDIGSNNANCSECGSHWDGKEPAPAGRFSANSFGLYDVHGNVWEWVADCYDDNAYKTHNSYPAKAGNWQDTCFRVLRGGSWVNDPRGLRSANRIRVNPVNRNNHVGFRVARTL